MPRIKSKVRKAIVGIEVINMTCECGDACANDRGSTMIEEHDVTVECTICGQTYNVPFDIFKKKFGASSR